MEPPPLPPGAPPPGLLDHPPLGAPAYFLGLLGVLALGVTAVVWPRQGGEAGFEGEPPALSAPALAAGGGPGGDYDPFTQPALPGLGRTELHLTTQEPGASVWIDQQPAGETPLRLHALRAGTHAILVTAGATTLLDTLVLIRTGALYHLHIAHSPPPSPSASARRPARRRPPSITELAPIAPIGAAELRAPARPPAEAPARRRDSTRIGW